MKKKVLGIVLSLVVFLSSVLSTIVIIHSETNSTNAASGNWSNYTTLVSKDNGWYEVDTAEKLAYISLKYTTFKSAKIKITTNIDLYEHYWMPIQEFSGTFDGQNFKITGMQVKEGTSEYSGLFGSLIGATVKNIRFYNCIVQSYYHSGVVSGVCQSSSIENILVDKVKVYSIYNEVGMQIYSGGIVGYVYEVSTITKCKIYNSDIYSYNLNDETAFNMANYCGGVVGYASYSTIKLCSVDKDTKVMTRAKDRNYNNSPEVYCGGISGYATSAQITKCYNESYIYANGDYKGAFVCGGGITGKSYYGSISNCYNSGEIDGFSNSITLTGVLHTKTGSKTQYASGVGVLWLYTLYMSSGKYTESGYGGNYGKSELKDVYSDTVNKLYLGGLLGFCNYCNLSYSYNIGEVEIKEETNRKSTLYGKWWCTGGETQCNLFAEYEISFVKNYGSGNICGNSYSIYNQNVYYKNQLTKSISSPTITSRVCVNGSYTSKEYGNSWKGYDWYIDSHNGKAYNTYFKFDATNPTVIYLRAQYKDKEQVSYQTYNTELGYSVNNGTVYLDKYGEHKSNLDTETISNLKFSSDIWAKDSKINGGYPYLKEFYW